MKGTVTYLSRVMKLQDILVGECFMFPGQETDVMMRVGPEQLFSAGIPYVSLTTGIFAKESVHTAVIPVHAEFTAKEMVIDREGL